eukprot:m.8057 g.8057  ORF g.8057 m.8057 type:complete len:156 (+) comp20299_c0_seq2:51-518(+)
MKRIAGGIMGLSFALRLAISLRLDGIPAVLELFAESLSPDNTSDVAVGIWHPPCDCSSPEERQGIEWAFASYEWLLLLTKQEMSGQIGIAQFSGLQLLSQDLRHEDPIWKNKVLSFSFASKREIAKRGFPSDAAGIYYSSIMIQGSRNCPWLLHW